MLDEDDLREIGIQNTDHIKYVARHFFITYTHNCTMNIIVVVDGGCLRLTYF